MSKDNNKLPRYDYETATLGDNSIVYDIRDRRHSNEITATCTKTFFAERIVKLLNVEG